MDVRRSGSRAYKERKGEEMPTGSDNPEKMGMDKEVCRRDFLKLVGGVGVTVGASAGLGGLLAACGGGATTTTSAGATTTAGVATTSAGATTTAGGATTTTGAVTATSAGVEAGPQVKIGLVSPITGALAVFGGPDKHSVARAQEAIGDGLVCADGLKHPVKIVQFDSQSDSNRAAQVAGSLIMDERVNLMVVAGATATIVPVADQCEANGVPCLSTEAPWESYVGARAKGDLTATFKWTYHTGWGIEDFVPTFVDVWAQIPNNKKVFCPLSNDDVGQTYATVLKKAFPAAGLILTMPDLYQPGTEDYTSLIATAKKEGCELMYGTFTAPDFTNFWAQCHQQGFKPKAACIGVALAFHKAAEMIGPTVINTMTPVQWTPTLPFTSPLLKGETCQQFADKYSQDTGLQWSQALEHFGLFDWATDVLKRAKTMDADAIVEAVKATKMDTLFGGIDFTAPIEASKPGIGHNHPNNYKAAYLAGQWRKSEGSKWPYDLVVVGNKTAPYIPLQGKPEPITY